MIKKIKNLALCGGGIYGYAELGALNAIALYPEYFDIQKISGTSVGSIIGTLYAVGYTAKDLRDTMFHMDMEYLVKGEKSMLNEKIYSWHSLFFRLGMYHATELENTLNRLIKEKTGIDNCTFSQIGIELTIIATNLNYQRPEFFNKKTSPDLSIARAVRMSISYPSIISPICYNGDLYGDGGQFINYPIIMYENELEETIGITFAAHNENRDLTLKKRIPITNLYEYALACASTMNRAIYIHQITEKYLTRSIIIEIMDEISSMQLNIADYYKHYFYYNGLRSAKKQLENMFGLPETTIEHEDSFILDEMEEPFKIIN